LIKSILVSLDLGGSRRRLGNRISLLLITLLLMKSQLCMHEMIETQLTTTVDTMLARD